jgi:1-acyl-sn-glycerol-3-phosphate acyltransferase
LKEPNLHQAEDRYKHVYKIVKKVLFIKHIKVNVENAEAIPKKPCLFVVNHKSNIDPFIIIKTLMEQKGLSYFSIIAKQELKQRKLVTAVMELIDSIFINRDDLRSMYEGFEKQKQAISKDDKSIVLYIEGHRYFHDEFGEFKSTALKIAYQTYIPIVPIAMYGTSGLMDKDKSNYNHKKIVRVKILTPLKPNEFITSSNEFIADKLKVEMQKTYFELKNKMN